jgi:hypothetical protein
MISSVNEDGRGTVEHEQYMLTINVIYETDEQDQPVFEVEGKPGLSVTWE